MKRSQALIPLAHQHHQALFVAHRLRRADQVDAALETFQAFWSDHGVPHFRVEEEVLLPCWAMLGTPDLDAIARIAREHLEIRRVALELDEGDPGLDRVRALGELLHAHVRYEERELFPAIERDLDPQALERLGAAVTAAEATP